MVKDLEEENVEQVMHLLKKFFDNTAYKELVPFSYEKTLDTVLQLMQSDSGVIKIAVQEDKVVGVLGALIFPLYYSDTLAAQELFWYMDEEARGKGLGKKLLQSVEQECKDKGADVLTMVALQGTGVGSVYERNGYSPSEQGFIRRL
jgi:GNAT superfamily N-acetyltransferase